MDGSQEFAALRIAQEEIAKNPQPFHEFSAIVLPVKTVGVQGDERSYENVMAIKVTPWDALCEETLANISNRITNEIPGLNRVVWDITQGQ